MCWSGEASAVLATIGFGTASYVAYKGESKQLWIPLTYFACMELLQAATYVYINLCDAPPNQILTLFGYIHIAFQPFFVNMVAMYFIPDKVREKISTFVYTVCAIGAIAMLVKMYPFAWAGTCAIGIEAFCGQQACSVSGDWHIAWQLPLNGLAISFNGLFYGLHGITYILVAFVMPAIYGSWRFVAFHIVMGPILSILTTRDPNEYAAVWCLFSIALCLSVIKSPIRKHLHVTTWPFYSRLEKA
jgi:Family of unknown function (DUF5765)